MKTQCASSAAGGEGLMLLRSYSALDDPFNLFLLLYYLVRLN